MTLDLGDGFVLRPVTADDHSALSFVCLKTGDAGQDATEREDDPSLLGLIFAVPYQVFSPQFAFLLVSPDGPQGYVLGALDTVDFNHRLAAEWYPELQRRIPPPPTDQARFTGSDWLRHIVHHPRLEWPPALAAYPSHAHIDLLPPARGRGIARKMMTHLEQGLRQAGSKGLYVEVDPRNANAIGFYEALGFSTLLSPDLAAESLFMAKSLTH